MAGLASSFLGAYRGAAPLDGGAALEAALHEVWARGREAWPGVDLAPEVLAAHLGERAPAETAVLPWVGAVRTGDVYLACACAEGVPAALRAFGAAHMDGLEGYLRSLRPTPELVAETRQELLAKLFVGTPGRPPKIRQYTAQGALGAWVRVAAVRTALNLLASEKAHQPHADDTDELARAITPAADPELDVLRATYKEGFGVAFREAMASLSPRERTILRLIFVERLTPARVGALYDVHRTTALRWIETAQAEVLARTRARMMERLHLSPSECDGVIALVKSRLDITLGPLLQAEP